MELKRFLNSVFARDTETSLSRREALAGLGLVGAVLATPTLIASRPAEAKPLDKAAEAESSKAHSEPHEKADQTQVAEAHEAELNADVSDATELSSRRHWRRHHWGWRRRHRGWRRRHWGWRRRHWGWRRRHWGWRRRHWRRYW
jgi:hypothetical protein